MKPGTGFQFFTFPALAAAMLALAGCGGGGGGGGSNLPSLPDDIPDCDLANRGVLNLWLIGHGYPPDVDEIPAPGAGWAAYSDPNAPLLSFLHPPDWTAYNLDSTGFLGFAVESPDQLSILKFGSGFGVPVTLTSQQVVDAEYDAIFPAPVAPTCHSHFEGTTKIVGVDSTLDVYETSGAIFVIGIAVYYDPTGAFGYNPGDSMNAAVRWVVAPAEEFSDRTHEVFLPILYQFLYGNDSDQDDSDGDGVPDVSDSFPNDPTRA